MRILYQTDKDPSRIEAASQVEIDGHTYRVLGVLYSRDRGYEYQLAEAGGLSVVRLCHAPTARYSRATVSGETITYVAPWKVQVVGMP